MAQVRNSKINCILSSAETMAGVVQLDPWLAPFKDALRHRYSKAQDWITALNKSEGGLEKFSRVSLASSWYLQTIDLVQGHREIRFQRR